MKASVYCASAATTRACRRLAEQFKSGKGGNSYLLASPDTLLSECIAFIAVAAENGGDDRLLRRIADGLCDDVRVLGSEGFRAEDADETVSLCRLSPAELKRRAFVLHLSDSSEAAQNKLLKTLEDAPASAVFFVTATSPSAVLPTVASRLEEICPDEPEEPPSCGGGENLPYALYGSRGSLTEFDDLISGRKTDALVSAIKLAELLGPSTRMLEATTLLGGTRKTFKDVLFYFEGIMGDVMRAEVGEETDTRGLFNIRTLTDKFPLAAMPRVLSAVRRAVGRSATGNLAAVADEFVVTVSEVMYHAKSSGRKV